MFKNISRSSILFFGGALLFFLVIQILISTGQLNVFWVTLLRVGAVMAIVSLGLNLIYGFNGQFSLGQWGFYALGAYAAADITYWWHNQKSATALVVVLLATTFVGIAILLLRKCLLACVGWMQCLLLHFTWLLLLRSFT
jgi:branched-chain amino acid transport system permease protein